MVVGGGVRDHLLGNAPSMTGTLKYSIFPQRSSMKSCAAPARFTPLVKVSVSLNGGNGHPFLEVDVSIPRRSVYQAAS